MLRSTLPILIAGLALSAAPVSSQAPGGQWSPLHRLQGKTMSAGFGLRAATAGDIDGDGVPDLIVGAPNADPAGRADAGSAFVYSGATGLLIAGLDGIDPGDQCGAAVGGLGDVDGDGRDDWFASAPGADPGGWSNAGALYVLSGGSGLLLWKVQGTQQDAQLGYAAADAGDCDGDGLHDLVAGAPQASPFNRLHAGSATVYSGADGRIVRRIDGNDPEDQLGYSVDGCEDANFDGLADVVLGAPFADSSVYVNSGSVWLVSPATGLVLVKLTGTDRKGELGWSVAGTGDVDQDGRGDFAAGIPYADQNGVPHVGRVRMFSGYKGAILFQWTGTLPQERLGYALGGPGDVNGDHFGDLLIGAPYAPSAAGKSNAGRVDLCSGFDARVLQSWEGAQQGDLLGLCVHAAGDLNQDGRADLLLGSSQIDAGGVRDAGEVRTWSYEPWLHPSGFAISSSAGGTVSYDIDFPASEAGMNYQVLASAASFGPSLLGGLSIPLEQDGVFQLLLNQTYPPGLLTGGAGVLNGAGDGQATLLVPPGGLASYVTRYFHFAVVSFDNLMTYRLSSGGMPLRIRR